MADAPLPLTDRLANLSFQTKLFGVGCIYMLAMAGLSEAGGGELTLRIWFASALPVSWLLALFLQWLSQRPRPVLGVAIGYLAERARARPLVAAFYAVAALVIETFAVTEAFGLPNPVFG